MDRHHDSARLLLSARRDPTQKLHSLPEAMRPQTEEQAYLIQRAIMAELGEIGAWKVGSPNPTGPFTCAPLPAAGVQASPGHVSTEQCTDQGVEASPTACRISAWWSDPPSPTGGPLTYPPSRSR